MLGHVAPAVLPGSVGLAQASCWSGRLRRSEGQRDRPVGTLYERATNAATSGFSIFYMGINIGALFGPLITGWLQ